MKPSFFLFLVPYTESLVAHLKLRCGGFSVPLTYRRTAADHNPEHAVVVGQERFIYGFRFWFVKSINEIFAIYCAVRVISEFVHIKEDCVS